jgi:pimeloyl-ACP methyl ester carboxylesterase
MMASREPVPAAHEPWDSSSAFLESRSGRVHYLDQGAGPAVLLLHGSGRSLADWQEGVAQLLAKHHRVIAFDYYGNGLSERSHSWRSGSVLWAQQGIDVLDALGIGRATLVGHSIGGVVAAYIAADHSDRVDAVVTIGTGMAIAPAQIPLLIPGLGEILLGRMDVFGDTFSEQHRARILSGYEIAGTRAALLTYIRRQYTIDGIRLLGGVWEEIRSPILHVSGSEDEQIPTEVAARLAARSGGKFVRVDGIRHDVHILAPDRLVREIEAFLDALKLASVPWDSARARRFTSLRAACLVSLARARSSIDVTTSGRSLPKRLT